ncbi:hypothetical protein [Rhizobium sp. AP16]|uniref:hypothetical protein n=1 Tax=Rhizobium sp. AP16 TaxID=1144306 RepID=UPI00026ED257|nr:hypothetical protein [Rhizobium sp. AP16]EJK83548.1 hypothetical protein PMI03_03203 [Rhizobium sp. AP16]
MTGDLHRYIEKMKKMMGEIDQLIEEDKMLLDMHRRFGITDEAGEKQLLNGLQSLEESRKRYSKYLENAMASSLGIPQKTRHSPK